MVQGPDVCPWLAQIEYCRKAMARTRVKSSICLEG